MEKLDVEYLAELVVKAQAGGSNAFAELYTATYQNTYAYAYKLLQNEQKARRAIKTTYSRALREINKLKEPELVVSWLFHLDFEVCQDSDNSLIIDMKNYRLAQLSKNLPMTESQVLIMRYLQSYSIGEIGKMLCLDRLTVMRNIKSGKVHLKSLLGEKC